LRDPRFRGFRRGLRHDDQPDAPGAGQLADVFVQGIGTALYERDPYDRSRHSRSPGTCRLRCRVRTRNAGVKIGHLRTPTPHTEYGMRAGRKEAAASPRTRRSPKARARTPLARSHGADQRTPITLSGFLAAIRKPERQAVERDRTTRARGPVRVA